MSVEPGSGSVDAGARDEANVVTSLVELRLLRGVTQERLSMRLNVEQSTVSRIERREDPTLRQVSRYVSALGGQLEVRVEVEGEVWRLELPDPPPPSG